MAHKDKVNAIAWHPENRKTLLSVGDDCRGLLWDTLTDADPSEASISNGGSADPTSEYQGPGPICNVAWSRVKSQQAAIGFSDLIQAVKV